MRKSRGLLDGVLANTDVVIYAKDLDGRFLLANPALHQLLRADDGDVLGRSDYDLFPAVVADQFRGARRPGGRHRRARRLRRGAAAPRRDRTRLPVDEVPASRRPPALVYAVAGVSTDVTELSQGANSARRIRAALAGSGGALPSRGGGDRR